MKKSFFYIFFFISVCARGQVCKQLLDTTPPVVIKVEVAGSHQLDVYFSEPVDILSSQITANYNLSGVGYPLTAVQDLLNRSLVHLVFVNRLASDYNYTLTVSAVRDLLFNIMAIPGDLLFTTPYYAVAGDVFINEIMIKPTTLLGLPNKQYVELRNATSHPIRLKNWKINNDVLLDGYLTPYGYAIINAKTDTLQFTVLGISIGVNYWTPLNSNGSVAIYADDNMLIDSLPYDDSTYQDTLKQRGGWSMELTYPGYSGSCPRDLFWSASSDVRGGTPGSVNKTGFPPKLVHATQTLLTNKTIEVDFHGPMDKTEVEETANYVWDNGVVVQSAVALDPYASKALITLSADLQQNILYHFIIKTFAGCAGYVHEADTFKIAITGMPQPGDLLLNEILFNPADGGEQFVEIYNKTNKIFKVKDLILSQADAVSGIENQILNLSAVEGYILSNNYLLLSRNKAIVRSQYPDAIVSNGVDVALPTFDTHEDIVVLKNQDNVEIDRLHYNESWHSPLLTNRRGTSLERTDPNASTQDKNNWHSASKEFNATPGYKNSEDTYTIQGDVHVQPEIFSPDGDGVDDELQITYSFDDAGSVVNATLYNADGRLAKHLATDMTIQKEGVFTWDGTNERGSKTDVGIYFLVLERRTVDGRKIVYKRRCGLATKLN